MKKFLLTAIFAVLGAWVFAQQPVVAVAPFEVISGISTADANALTGVFYNRLGNANVVTLVDRSVVERVIREHQFQLEDDWSNARKTAEIGEALNADWIVRGRIESYRSNIIINVQFYDINTFQFRGGDDISLSNADEAYEKMTSLVNSLVATITGGKTAQPIPEGLLYEVVDGKTVTITKYFGIAATLNIPSQIEGLLVTSIGQVRPGVMAGYRVFSDCGSLTSVIIPPSVTEINSDAFADCKSLTSVTIPSSVTYIGSRAFRGCSSLTSVTIPSSVTEIGEAAFAGCLSLTSITVDNRNPEYASIDGVLFDKIIWKLIQYPVGRNPGTYVIPSSVGRIDYFAFAGCSSLTNITIPSSVTYIAYGAFENCNSLTSVTLSRRMSVGEGAFPESTRVVYRD